MKGATALLCTIILVLDFHSVCSNDVTLNSLKDGIDVLVGQLSKSNSYAERMTKQIGTLTRQVMLQQLFVEERLRSEGQSGIKQIRIGIGGTKTYHKASHVGRRVAAIHDHSNNIRTVGMGEFIAVLNGVEFRTRHNDYRLSMPSNTTGDYHMTEDIPFPNVPPEVEQKETVKEQVEEMVKWFRAWKYENDTQRDHRKYFKPVLCYLEGAWTKSTRDIDEPFESDRHFVDAKSWFDLQEKIRFTSYTGRKHNQENFAYLPTTIMEIINETTAVFAQWNYRILCHPLKTDVPLSRLRMIDDLGSRLTNHHTVEEHEKTRSARFQVNPRDSNTWKDTTSFFGLLDKLMAEIPGKNNYPGNLTDDALDQNAYSMDPEKNGEILNAAYHHRLYKVMENGAMGIQARRRGFSDTAVFMALNTQEEVAGMTLSVCKRQKQCQKYEQRWSYAIPLEIIYLTPLNTWNPYNLTYRGKFNSDEGKIVNANGRNGGQVKDKAFNGVNSKTYYITPNEFYTGTETHVDAADTTRESVGVLDPNGTVQKVRASGVRIFFPDIPGVGILRQRYPIMPIHAEGSTTWKELEAVQDFLMQSNTHARLFREKLAAQPRSQTHWLTAESDNNGGTTTPWEKNNETRLLTGYSSKSDITRHAHEIILTEKEVNELIKQGNTLNKTTGTAESHQHEVVIGWLTKMERFFMVDCAGTPEGTKIFFPKCMDLHYTIMKILPDQ